MLYFKIGFGIWVLHTIVFIILNRDYFSYTPTIYDILITCAIYVVFWPVIAFIKLTEIL